MFRPLHLQNYVLQFKNNKFSNFDKCSTSHWNLTREQYEWLTGKMENEI